MDFGVSYNDLSTLLENYNFSFHIGSWGSLNYDYSTRIETTVFNLGYTMQLINILANDSVHIDAITKVNQYIEVKDTMSVELNRFLAAALIVGATVGIPVMAMEISKTLKGLSPFIQQLGPKFA